MTEGPLQRAGVEISVVSPVFNEEKTVEEFFDRVYSVLSSLEVAFELILVDDGSDDRSFEILKMCYQNRPECVRIVRLGRNFGHQLAITAGIRYASGKAVIVMDSDLQDPPETIREFIRRWREGADIVYGIRKERKGESLFKKTSALLFYKLIRAATKIDIPENVGDFYLLDRKVVEELNQMQERHRFIRGLVAWVGFKRIGVEYVREARFAGKTKFGFWRMLHFAFDAATSFSFLPLRFISFMGVVISGFAFLGILLIIYMRLFTTATITGWSSLMVVVLFIGGIQLLALGLFGEYVARIGDDVKRRPLYTVKEVLGGEVSY